MAVLYRCYEGLYLVVVALGIDLVVGECGCRVVAGIEVFDSSVVSADFLVWDTEDGRGFRLEGQVFHLREAVYAF